MTHNNSKVSSGLLLNGRYKLLRPLSSDGGTADVWLALDTNTIDEFFDDDRDELTCNEDSGIKVAIKIYRPKNALDIGEQRFREEFKIVFNCHHTNLIQPINFSISDGIPYLVLPFCKNGSSEKLQGKFHDKQELWKYIYDVSSGLAYLHAYNPTIVHHDIKPANVLIDDNNNYAITDFGISSHRGLNRDGYEETQSGTMAYMAPERFRDDYESIPESDIWSFGATLYELITGEVPFGEMGGLAQIENKSSCPPISIDIPSDIKRLVYDCLSSDPSKRPSASDIKIAAEKKHYPLKSKKIYYISGALLSFILFIILLLVLSPKKNANHQPLNQLSNKEKFENAMILVNRNDADSLKLGLIILDSLGMQGYVPALYEQVLTYGWYEDSTSLARKVLLGIDYYSPKSEMEYLPKSKQINIKTIGLISKIEELSDPKYPEINANSLYKLATYYVNDNDIFQKDIDRARIILTKAQEWAEKSNNQDLLNKINRNLMLLED